MIHCKIAVANPQPAEPSAGIGPKPYIKTKFSGTKRTKAAKLMTVTGRGWPSASEYPRSAAYIVTAGMPKPMACKNRLALGSKFAGTPMRGNNSGMACKIKPAMLPKIKATHRD